MHLFVSLSDGVFERYAVVHKVDVPLVVSYAVFWYRGDGLALGALRPESESLPARPEGQMRGCFISGFPVFWVLVRISEPPLKSNTGTPP